MLFRNKTPGSQKGKSSSKKQTETPFEARRKALAEQEAALKAETEKHKRFIEVAPKIAAERQKEQREIFLKNAASADRKGHLAALQLPDSRYLHNEAAVMSPRSRRKDREKGKWIFFLLVGTLLVAAYWAWLTLSHPDF
ncbi:MAG: hypothetical protein WCO60_14180 [Verrucomicrobiota bacterium]